MRTENARMQATGLLVLEQPGNDWVRLLDEAARKYPVPGGRP